MTKNMSLRPSKTSFWVIPAVIVVSLLLTLVVLNSISATEASIDPNEHNVTPTPDFKHTYSDWGFVQLGATDTSKRLLPAVLRNFGVHSAVVVGENAEIAVNDEIVPFLLINHRFDGTFGYVVEPQIPEQAFVDALYVLVTWPVTSPEAQTTPTLSVTYIDGSSEPVTSTQVFMANTVVDNKGIEHYVALMKLQTNNSIRISKMYLISDLDPSILWGWSVKFR